MNQPDMETLRFPTGRYQMPETVSDAEIAAHIEAIRVAPAALRRAVDGLDDSQLDTPYRPDGWTVRQVVHHVPDSHGNALVRFRWALTEDHPRIKAYNEGAWAELPDGKSAPIAASLDLLDAIHGRWMLLLPALGPAEWARTFEHPEGDVVFRLDQTLALYAWHGRHHVAHVTALRERMGW
ncbi:MAG: YfiT family bacillithiol transferase [Acidobacteriota bacterium]